MGTAVAEPLIEIRSPVTSKIIKTYPEAQDSDIVSCMQLARQAFPQWRDTPLGERLRRLRNLREIIAGSLEQIISSVAEVTGKVPLEILSSDIYSSLEILRYYELHSEKILKTRAAPTPAVFRHASSYVQYDPAGVALIISPWNYPLYLALAPMAAALAAGNTVVLKPSEVTLSVGELIGSLCGQAGFPQGVVQVVYGTGAAGAKLIGAGPDRIFFTGSAATGRKVMEAAAGELIPLVLELGAKDPMIVFEDAHFERAVRGAVYGAFSNSGQICVSVERLYVQRPIYDRFLEALEKEAAKVRVGSGMDADVGPLIFSPQARIIDDHIDDALRRGARLLGKRERRGFFYSPVLLADVNHTMKIMKEETFGPVLPVMPFTTEDEAVCLANDSVYGLNASVWTGDLEKGRRVAGRLDTGNCAINDVVKNIGNPYLPFGGVKHSGFGRYHAADGLLAFCNSKSVTVNTGKTDREINWFPYRPALYTSLKYFLQSAYGRAGIGARLRGYRRAWKALRGRS
jgi:acyl-CoA reductase-like NAD-dependent aldehyde dehydrogenase